MTNISKWIVAILITLGLGSTAMGQIASDNAADEVYADEWQETDNGGTGFQVWTLPGSSGAGGFNGFFVGTPNDAGFTMINYAPMLTDNKAFSIYAGGDNNAFQDARRDFLTALELGNKFSVSLAFTFDNGNKGLSLFSGEAEVFNFNINDTGYSWTGGGTAPMTGWEGLRINGVVIDFEFTQTASGFDYVVSSAQGLSASGSVAGSAIDGMKFYISGAGGGDPGNLFFNNLEIEAGTPPALTFTDGTPTPLEIGPYNYTLVRNDEAVTDEIFLSSSNTDVLTVPATVSFASEQNVLVFTAEVVSVTSGPATITASNSASGAVATYTVTPQIPPITLDVTFSVDMSVQIALGNFDTSTDGVEVRGSFNSFSGGSEWALTAVGAGIYEGTFEITAGAGSTVTYKFYATPDGGLDWEGAIGDRSFVLEGEDPIVRPTVFFNDLAAVPQTLNITFSVDMSVQIALGNFDASTDGVEVRGSFNGFSGGSEWALTAVGAGIYEGTFEITAGAGSTVTYKFYATPDGGLDWEGAIGDRSFVLEGEDPIILPTVFFNDQGPTTPEGPAIATFNIVDGAPQITIVGEADKTYTLVSTTNLLGISYPELDFDEWDVGPSTNGVGSLLLISTNSMTDPARFFGVLVTEDVEP